MTDNSLLHVARSWQQFLCVISLTFACPAITQLRLSLSPSALASRVLRKSHKLQCVDYAIFMFAFARAAHKKKADNNALHLAAAAAARTDSSNKGE